MLPTAGKNVLGENPAIIIPSDPKFHHALRIQETASEGHIHRLRAHYRFGAHAVVYFTGDAQVSE